VAPTFCSTNQKEYTLHPQKYIDNLIDRVKEHGWKSVVTKPVYGQEAIGFSKFINLFEKESTLNRFVDYITNNIYKYKSIIFQEYIEGFDQDNPEIRTYFINGTYAYSIITTQHLSVQSIHEGGTYSKLSKEEWDYIISFAKKVMKTLPQFDMKNKHPILTRIDIGSGMDRSLNKGYFVNEIEFVPSLYIENNNFPVLEKIGDTLVKIVKGYNGKKIKVKW
jgi:glutathione synthase/RimK-type ligase-like ATP-grasp enzyme